MKRFLCILSFIILVGYTFAELEEYSIKFRPTPGHKRYIFEYTFEHKNNSTKFVSKLQMKYLLNILQKDNVHNQYEAQLKVENIKQNIFTQTKKNTYSQAVTTDGLTCDYTLEHNKDHVDSRSLENQEYKYIGKLFKLSYSESGRQTNRDQGLAIKGFLSDSAIFIPEKPIKVGDVWKISEKDKICGQLNFTCNVEEFKIYKGEECAVLDLSGSISGNLNMKINSGKVYLSISTGLVEKYEIEFVDNSASIFRVSLNSIKD